VNRALGYLLFMKYLVSSSWSMLEETAQTLFFAVLVLIYWVLATGSDLLFYYYYYTVNCSCCRNNYSANI